MLGDVRFKRFIIPRLFALKGGGITAVMVLGLRGLLTDA